MLSVKKRRREEEKNLRRREESGSNEMSGFSEQFFVTDFNEGPSQGPSQSHNGNWRQNFDVLKLFQQLASAKRLDYPYTYFRSWQDPAFWMMMICQLYPGVPSLNCPSLSEFTSLVPSYCFRFYKGEWPVGFEAQMLKDYMNVFTKAKDLGPLTDSTFSVFSISNALVATNLNNQGVCLPPPQESGPSTDSEEMMNMAEKLVKALKPFQRRFPDYAMIAIEDNLMRYEMKYRYFLSLSYSEREEYIQKRVDVKEADRRRRSRSRRHR